MILSNVEVQKALRGGRLVIDPMPMPLRPTLGQHCPYDTHTVDLTLGNEIVVPIEGLAYNVDFSIPGKVAELITRSSETRTITDDSPFQLSVQKFVLAKTAEIVGLPIPQKGRKCLAARIEGKSSRARFGLLVHFTAPTVHPGWHGPLTLEMINLGAAPILLKPGITIAQLIVEEVSGIPFENESQFHNQRTPAGLKRKLC